MNENFIFCHLSISHRFRSDGVCEEQGFFLCAVSHMTGWETSLIHWKVTLYCLPVSSLKRKHVCCLITAWHLTVLSDQSDEFFFPCWPSGETATTNKHAALSLSSNLSKAVFRHSYQHQIPLVPRFFSIICLFLFLSNSPSLPRPHRNHQEKSLPCVKGVK